VRHRRPRLALVIAVAVLITTASCGGARAGSASRPTTSAPRVRARTPLDPRALVIQPWDVAGAYLHGSAVNFSLGDDTTITVRAVR
jgi:hypothetical protein